MTRFSARLLRSIRVPLDEGIYRQIIAATL